MGETFSTLQRVEIAEIVEALVALSVDVHAFSTLQRVEIAEIRAAADRRGCGQSFQYSSTSRNC